MDKSIPKMKPEILFLKYAFPCSMVLMQRKEITQKTFYALEKAAINNQQVKRKLLEKIYFRAITRMKALAKEKNKNYFSEEVVREYFTKRHNQLLDGMFQNFTDKGIDIDSRAPSALKQLCKVFRAKIIRKCKGYYIVKYSNKKTRPVLSDLLPKAEVGDIVTIHYGYAVEKLD